MVFLLGIMPTDTPKYATYLTNVVQEFSTAQGTSRRNAGSAINHMQNSYSANFVIGHRIRKCCAVLIINRNGMICPI